MFVNVSLGMPAPVRVTIEEKTYDVFLSNQAIRVTVGADTRARQIVQPLTAAATLAGHRIVRTDADGRALYASNDEEADAGRALGMSTGAAEPNEAVLVLLQGIWREPTWAWDPSCPVYLATNGGLTQTPPSAASGARFQQIVGIPLSPTRLYLDIRQAVILAFP